MIYIVIPVHNRINFTRQCLYSLYRQSVDDFKIVIIDDGSNDGTSEILSHEFPEVSVIKGDGNLFWTASINLGIAYSLKNGADHILTMNNDTTVDSEFLEKMIYWNNKRPNALLGALEIDSVTRKPHYGGELINWLADGSTYLLEELKPEEQNGLHEVSLYPARGLFIPRVVFEKIGLFEENKLPHYMADYDFTLQARKAGFKVFCNYDAHVYTYPEESGDFDNRKSKNLRNYINHLFGIKGGANLKNYTIYVFRNCPPVLIPASLISGYLRRIFGFWLKG
jgi:GT2 family glycosyltransferase